MQQQQPVEMLVEMLVPGREQELEQGHHSTTVVASIPVTCHLFLLHLVQS
jgi:hypothetical protein